MLSLFFRAALGIERIFHFETLDDAGFAILSGGKKVMSRSRLGGLVRAVTTAAVKKLTHATESWGALRHRKVTLSLDEHVVARFTRKFKIPKGFHTLRNKKMRAEKLFFLHWPKARRFLGLVVTRGNGKLIDRTVDFLRAVRRRVRVRQLRLIIDAGASATNEGLRRLDRFSKTVFLIRAPRRPGYVNAWKRLPRARFTPYEEPGRYKGAKPKQIELTETTTTIRGIARPLRTVVVRERAMKGKDRWHALFVLHDDTTPPLELLHEYRTRQHHEQGHRIGVRDLWIDTSASGYPKRGRPDRPGFRQGPLALCAWVAALAWDALLALGDALPPRFRFAHPRTLRRWVLMRDADLILTPSHLLVVLASPARRAWLRPLVQRFNAAEIALPWLGGRRVVMGFAATGRTPSDARPVLPQAAEVGSGSAKGYGGVWC
ncbi:hypothetical protein [Sorangium sp. So ce131]|uniref:hypothetical protein n=1 Tax=Sorangium sp. So ce131 TaxID=3133282 RepID=UPI003F5F001E